MNAVVVGGGVEELARLALAVRPGPAKVQDRRCHCHRGCRGPKVLGRAQNDTGAVLSVPILSHNFEILGVGLDRDERHRVDDRRRDGRRESEVEGADDDVEDDGLDVADERDRGEDEPHPEANQVLEPGGGHQNYCKENKHYYVTLGNGVIDSALASCAGSLGLISAIGKSNEQYSDGFFSLSS